MEAASITINGRRYPKNKVDEDMRCALCYCDVHMAPLDLSMPYNAKHGFIQFLCGHAVHNFCWGRHAWSQDVLSSLNCPVCGNIVFCSDALRTFDATWSLQEDCLAVEFEKVDGSMYYLAPVEALRLDIGVKAKYFERGLTSTWYHTKPHWDCIHVLVQATPDTDSIFAVSSTIWLSGSTRCITVVSS